MVSHSTSRRAIGRPRRLTLGQVIAAGVELGLEDLSVSAVAIRLGVSVGTIYTYVENRDELVRLVAASLRRRPPVEDKGQHWTQIARDHATCTFDSLCNEPAMLTHMVAGTVEPDDTLPEMEGFIALLATRGFTDEAAFALYHGCGQIAVGAALTVAMARAWEKRGEPRRLKVRRLFAERPEAFPHLVALGAILREDDRYFDYRPTLEHYLAQVAAERGETLPMDPE